MYNYTKNHTQYFVAETLTQNPSVQNRQMVYVPGSQEQAPQVPIGDVPGMAISPIQVEPDKTQLRKAGHGKGRILRMADDSDLDQTGEDIE
jgi:hypothetical protein